MDRLLTCVLCAALMIAHDACAWTIGAKTRVLGPTIHITYFLTPNNELHPVKAQAYVGAFRNGACQYNMVYELGTEMLRTGDTIHIDAFELKSIIGTTPTCITMYYTYTQLVMETFILFFDGFNYINTFPQLSQVTIL